MKHLNKFDQRINIFLWSKPFLCKYLHEVTRSSYFEALIFCTFQEWFQHRLLVSVIMQFLFVCSVHRTHILLLKNRCYCAYHVLVQPILFLLFARSSPNSPRTFQCLRRTLRRIFNWIRQQMKNFPIDPHCKNCTRVRLKRWNVRGEFELDRIKK